MQHVCFKKPQGFPGKGGIKGGLSPGKAVIKTYFNMINTITGMGYTAYGNAAFIE